MCSSSFVTLHRQEEYEAPEVLTGDHYFSEYQFSEYDKSCINSIYCLDIPN